jgi:hypothetical protein
LLGAACLPLFANVSFAFGNGVSSFIDLTPVAFVITDILLSWLIFRRGILGLVPITNDQIMENIQEGILICDNEGRLFASNLAFNELFNLPFETRGKPIDEVLVDWPKINGFLSTGCNNDFTINPILSPDKCYELNLTSITNRRGVSSGFLMTVKDITGRKQVEGELVARQHYLAALNELTHDALEASNLPCMLQTLADHVGNLLKADGGYITLWDNESNVTIPAAVYGELRNSYPATQSIPGELTMTQSVLNLGHAIVAEDVSNTPYMSRSPKLIQIYTRQNEVRFLLRRGLPSLIMVLQPLHRRYFPMNYR